MRNNIYKLAWLLSPALFLVVYALKGRTCLMGACEGDNNLGVAYGIGTLIVYFILLKFMKPGESLKFWDINGIKSGFFFFLLILVVLLVYYLGKANS